MSVLELSFEEGETSLSVRRFSVHEAVSSLFTVSIWARAENPSIDLEAIVGKQASLRIVSGQVFALHGGSRFWTGVVSAIEQVQAVQSGVSAKELSTYSLRIVPTLWLLTQRRGYRTFQHITIPDIVDKLLGEWSITPTWKIDRAKYPRLEYRMHYGVCAARRGAQGRRTRGQVRAVSLRAGCVPRGGRQGRGHAVGGRQGRCAPRQRLRDCAGRADASGRAPRQTIDVVRHQYP